MSRGLRYDNVARKSTLESYRVVHTKTTHKPKMIIDRPISFKWPDHMLSGMTELRHTFIRGRYENGYN